MKKQLLENDDVQDTGQTSHRVNTTLRRLPTLVIRRGYPSCSATLERFPRLGLRLSTPFPFKVRGKPARGEHPCLSGSTNPCATAVHLTLLHLSLSKKRTTGTACVCVMQMWLCVVVVAVVVVAVVVMVSAVVVLWFCDCSVSIVVYM